MPETDLGEQVADNAGIVTAKELLLPPILVVTNATEDSDDDELLFEPASPDESKTSSVGTPPTPEHRKFVWPSDEEETKTDELAAEPTADEPQSLDAFVQGEGLRRSSTVSSRVEDGDHEERLSMMSTLTASSSTSSALFAPSSGVPTMNAAVQVVKEKTQKAAVQQREVISRFQLKGGLVGWLHGETDVPNRDTSARTEEIDESPVNVPEYEQPRTPARPRGSSLFGNLYDKMKQKQEQLEQKLQAFDQPPPSHQLTYIAENHKQPPHARRSLQPTPRRTLGGESADHIGFDDFVSVSPPTAQVAGKPLMRRDSRLRSASSSEVYQSSAMKTSSGVRSRLRSLSFATRSTKPSAATDLAAPSSASLPPSALQWDAFPMEECLADPKLAAEFINTVLPGDEWLLTLLYSIEEYETLTTVTAAAAGAAEPSPSLDLQVSMAITIIDRFLAGPLRAAYFELEAMGKEVRAVAIQYQLPSHADSRDDLASVMAAQATTLPMTLFDSVYSFVFDKLREAYDSQFRLTREYTQLLAIKKQQQQKLGDEKSLQHLVLTFDQVIESEWCCTVFWVYLFRTSHHHRLSFIMDVKFKLRRLHLAAQQAEPDTPEATQTLKLLRHEILLICRRFLTSKLAVLALPTTSAMLMRLKDELCVDASELERADELDLSVMQRMIEKLDAMRTQTRVEFKRMSFERFATFLTSTLYRDSIVHPGSSSSSRCTRADDLTQLLRVNRISFHQTAVSAPTTRELLGLRDADGAINFDKAIATVFTFRKQGGASQGFEFVDLHLSALEDEATIEILRRTVECFLLPEASNATLSAADAAKLPSSCFNFLVGTGDATVYGAVWRYGVARDVVTEDDGSLETKSLTDIQGVCVLSRYPLVDGLREFLRNVAFPDGAAETVDRSSLPIERDLFPHNSDDSSSVIDLCCAKEALAVHYQSVLAEPALSSDAAVLDSTLQDLFECLSITHVMRLLSLLLQEKKIVMVSSSYSVLLTVGEALHAMLAPLVWSHIYVPVLPMGMKGYLHCPTPFIFGLHTSYARHCELPKPSDDLAVVNLDRDSLTGGGDVGLPPLRANALRDRLTALCKPRLRTRDVITFDPRAHGGVITFPSDAIRHVVRDELRDILRHLETFAFRFACADRTVSVVDSSNKSRQWPADAARFYSAVLQSQAFSTFLGGQSA